MTNMKLIHFATTAYGAVAALFEKHLMNEEDVASDGIISSICFLRTELAATGRNPIAEVAPTALSYMPHNSRPIEVAEAVSFSMQLAILQQSVHRANIPCHVPVPVRKHHFATT